MRGVYLLVVAALLCLGAGVVSAQGGGDNSVSARVDLLNNNDVNDTIDFGFIPLIPPSGAIGDRVWEDRNEDGIQDDGEPGIGGVTVYLLDDRGGNLNSTTTDSNGIYWFRGLFAGNYTVSVDIPAGYEPTLPYQGGPAEDSNGV